MGWGLYSGGSDFFFDDVLGGGVENKNPLGQGGGHIFHQVFGGGGVRCVPLVFAFIKSQGFWGGSPDYPYPK